jgi:hypothetical protein
LTMRKLFSTSCKLGIATQEDVFPSTTIDIAHWQRSSARSPKRAICTKAFQGKGNRGFLEKRSMVKFRGGPLRCSCQAVVGRRPSNSSSLPSANVRSSCVSCAYFCFSSRARSSLYKGRPEIVISSPAQIAKERAGAPMAI